MEEKLIIRNFGPIKDVTLDLRKINVFIGDQGTGKSTVAKLYAIVNEILYLRNLSEIKSEKELRIIVEKIFIKYEISNMIEPDTYIKFVISQKSEKKIEFKLENLNYYVSNNAYLYNFNCYNSYIIAERGMVSLLADALFGINESGAKLTSLFNRFGSLYTSARKSKKISSYKKILGVDFLHSRGVDKIVNNENKQLLFIDGSSGIQSTIPLLLTCEFLLNEFEIIEGIGKFHEVHFKRQNLIIEEPEQNLFPETQKKLVNHIININKNIENKEFTNLNDKFEKQMMKVVSDWKANLLITTHSPYILSTLNNLMFAYNVGSMENGINKNAVNEIIPVQNWVNPNDVSCYLMKDGKAFSIKDKEGLIEASTIDSVSKELNEEYDKIINIEIGIAQ